MQIKRHPVFDDPTKPIDLTLLEQHRARARRTAMTPTVIVSPLALVDEDETRATKPRAAVGTLPPPIRMYPAAPSRDPRPLVALLIALASVAAMLSIVFYGT